MKKLVSLTALLLIGCPPNNPTPIKPPIQQDAGGTTGGNTTTTGGSSAIGGSSTVTTGGNVATGGSVNGGTTSCSPIETLIPQPTAAQEMRKSIKTHTVGKRHHRKKGRAISTKEAVSVTLQCPVQHDINDKTPLNQDVPQPTGSCTGNGSVTVISTQQFKGNEHHNQTDARKAYQGGTCEDNNCTIPCTCTSCPAAFCPDTNANDTGSTGSSVMAWMKTVGWIKDYTTADTIDDLKLCLAKGSNPTIGLDWWSGMDNPGKDAEIFATGYIRGGHEPALIGWDGSKFIGINSWGLWGYCRKTQITPNTTSDGTGCGFFKISPDTLTKAKFDGDCPIL